MECDGEIKRKKRTRKPLTVDAAKQRMAALCARSETSSHEVREKLRRAEMAEGDIAVVLRFLTENKFVDDRRFACAFARDKARFSGWGRRKIRMGLMAKRIGEENIREALDSLPAEDYELSLMAAVRSRAAGLDPEDYADRAKLFRRMASRGFDPEDISRAITQLRHELREAEDS